MLIRKIFILFILLSSCSRPNDTEVKSILSEQLKNTHTNEDWFMPLSIAVKGLTQEQANWKDSTTNHSICELVSHLSFWNERILIAFEGKIPPHFNNDNEITFTKYCYQDWNRSLQKIDSIQVAWETAMQRADSDQIDMWGSEVANMAAHTAYHTGQIVYIRKQNGWWDE